MRCVGCFKIYNMLVFNHLKRVGKRDLFLGGVLEKKAALKYKRLILVENLQNFSDFSIKKGLCRVTRDNCVTKTIQGKNR